MKNEALNTLQHIRKNIVWKLFDNKFNADYRISIGSATCENAAGSEQVYNFLTNKIDELNLRNVRIGRVGCTGRCDMEPIMTVIPSGSVPIKYVHVTPEKAQEIVEKHLIGGSVVEKYTMHKADGRLAIRKFVTFCDGKTCGRHNDLLFNFLKEQIANKKLEHNIYLSIGACRGKCAHGPVMHVAPDNITYGDLDQDKIVRIVKEHFLDNHIVSEYFTNEDTLTNKSVPLFGDIHFFGKQLRMTLRNCGVIDPESVEEYVAVGGYKALATILETMQPNEVIQQVRTSGLKGRGGGGFPTADKWQLAANNKADNKYVICNADEGDPGAFMDRSIIEGDPHSVLEGMLIAGYAIGATRGFVYIRAEYPLAIKRLEKAIEQAHSQGLLGSNILGTGWGFTIELRLGAGAFVCGEETALIRSIEGYRGEPKQKPPFPTDSGLWGKPTIINNVETFANLAVVLIDGAEWFGTIGTPKSQGTKVFALAGKVRNTGLIEVPMGTTLREVIFDIGGGISTGKKFKAVQTGGPAGGCLPEQLLDTPIDYNSLREAGSIMGSGGMIVIDEETCMVDLARYFMEFIVEESCGQCTPCRAGTAAMLRYLEKIIQGKATLQDLEKLEELAKVVSTTSLCGLGKAAPNPVASTLKYFRSEYLEHIVDKKCRAGVCTSLTSYEIITDKCTGCRACVRKCPSNCITGMKKEPHEIIEELCIRCGVCMQVCKFGAVTKKPVGLKETTNA